MYRSLALAIVLCVTAGQDAVAACRAWCAMQESEATACSHPGSPSGEVLRPSDHCTDPAPATPVLVRDDIRRPVAPMGVVGTGLLVRSEATRFTRWLSPDPGPPISGALARPLPLRI